MKCDLCKYAKPGTFYRSRFFICHDCAEKAELRHCEDCGGVGVIVGGNPVSVGGEQCKSCRGFGVISKSLDALIAKNPIRCVECNKACDERRINTSISKGWFCSRKCIASRKMAISGKGVIA